MASKIIPAVFIAMIVTVVLLQTAESKPRCQDDCYSIYETCTNDCTDNWCMSYYCYNDFKNCNTRCRLKRQSARGYDTNNIANDDLSADNV